MPRYYFDTFDGETLLRDDEGFEFHDLDAARAEAAFAIGEMARDAMPDGMHREFRIDVRDEGGRPVLRVTFTLNVERLA